MSRVILVAMLLPSGETLHDLLATMVEPTPQTGTSNLAQIHFSWGLAVWNLAARSLEDGDEKDAPFVHLTYESPWIAAIPTTEFQRSVRVSPDVYQLFSA